MLLCMPSYISAGGGGGLVYDDDSWFSVSSLMHFDGSNGSTTFTDETNRPWTANGNVQISTAQSKFGGSSVLFDGAGDYLSTVHTAAFQFGSAAFTIEMWVYPTSFASKRVLVTKRDAPSDNNTYELYIEATTGKVGWRSSTNGTTFGVTALTTSGITLNAWTHVAIVRNGSNFNIYINGVSDGSTTSASAIATSTVAFTVGATNNGGDPFVGYIDELRVTKGVARYTGTFTPQSVQFEPIENNRFTASLLHFDGSNGSTTFTDERGFTFTAVGNAQLSTTTPKDGSACLLLDGTGDYVTSANHPRLDFYKGDFCIEGWVRWASVTNAGIFHLHPSSPPPATVAGLALGYDGANFQVYEADGTSTAYAHSVSAGTYYHFALYREGTNLRLAIDGTVKGTISNSVDISTGILHLGLYYSSAFCLNGRLDEIRISKGSSVYSSSNFTPPTPPFTLDS